MLANTPVAPRYVRSLYSGLCAIGSSQARRKQVFTRAEHRRRHELNHNPEASYRCTQTGCKKAFHRPDLLARHMERQ